MSKQTNAYMMAYFRSGPGQSDKTEKLHYAYSRDGLHWHELNRNEPVWSSSLGEGILRDPFIGKGADGKWHMVFTIRPGGSDLGYASSRDLIHWEGEKAIPAMAAFQGTANSWAPEFNYDAEAGEYMLYWASSLGPKIDNNKHYGLKTSDWETFGEAKLLFDPGYRTIDASIAEHDGKYYMFYKDEEYVYDKAKQPHPPGNKLAVADKLDGPYEIVSDFITPDFTEGPEIVKLNGEDKWLLYYDYWAHGKLGVVASNNLRDWSEEISSDKVKFPYRARHFTIFSVTEEELDALLDRFGVEARYPTHTFNRVRVADWASAGRLHDEFGQRSVTLWFQSNSTFKRKQVLFDEGGVSSGLAVRLSEGRIEAAVASEGRRLVIGSEIRGEQEWHYAAVVFERGAFSLYLNGERVASGLAPFEWVEPHHDPGGYGARFGGDAFGDSGESDDFAGEIRAVKLYSVPLQPEDVRRMFAASK